MSLSETKLSLSILPVSCDDYPLQGLIDQLSLVPWISLVGVNADVLLAVGPPSRIHETLLTMTIPKGVRVWAYLIQRYETEAVEPLNDLVERCFTTNGGWRSLQRQQGITRPVDVLPAGLSPLGNVDRRSGRALLHIPDDVFLIVSVHRNLPYKRYDTLIQAFVELIVKHPHKPIFLMCVCDPKTLFDLFSRELKEKGVVVADYSNRLMVSTQYESLTDDQAALFYSIADCGVSCADGESSGIGVLEQMAYGIPHVVSNLVAHRAFCTADNSILVEPVVRIQGSQGEDRRLVAPTAVAQALETYVVNEPLRLAHGISAAAAATSYGWPSAVKGLIRRLDLVRQERDLDVE